MEAAALKYAVLLPLIISGSLLLLAWRPWNKTVASSPSLHLFDSSSWASGASAIGFAVSYLSCHYGMCQRV